MLISGGAMKEIEMGDDDNIGTVKTKSVGTRNSFGYLENTKSCKVTDLDKFIMFQIEKMTNVYITAHMDHLIQSMYVLFQFTLQQKVN